MSTSSPCTSSAPPAPAGGPLLVIGVGTAGVNLLATLRRTGFQEGRLVALSPEPVAGAAGIELLALPTTGRHGLATGGDPERGRALAEENLARLTALCQGAEVVWIITGLGGGAGTGISPVLARVAREAGALVLAFAVMPFECEGSRRLRRADHGLRQLRAAADGVVCLPNQKVFKLLDERTSLQDTFPTVNELLADGLRGVGRLLTRPGILPLHLAELCGLLRGAHTSCALASVETHGANRVRDAAERLLAHPLLDGAQTLAQAQAVVLSLTGGPELSMLDVQRLMDQITRHCEQAQALLGVAVDEAFRERLAVTVLAVGQEGPAAPAGEPAAEAVGAARPAADADEFLPPDTPVRTRPRLLPPAPALRPEQLEEALARQNGTSSRARKNPERLRQGTLPLEVVSRGRFEKTEPNIRHGEDLDLPTYLRRGCVLN